jgi:hypothetical protein
VRYREYRLTAVSTPEFNGTYRSRAALTVVRLGRPLSQRFVDFEVFSTKAAADEYAIKGAKIWIDEQSRATNSTFRDDYDTLV